MGREARRVPLDFDWPIGEVWGGYLMPGRLQGDPCPDCENGLTADAELLNGIAYMIVGLADDTSQRDRGREMHPYLRPIYDIAYVHGRPRPTPRFEEFVKALMPDDRGYGLLGRQPYGMAARLLELAGLDDKWGWCPTCNGEATVESYPGQAAEADAWEASDPPGGEGWQMWETTSEGSPQTPVFKTAEELAGYCESSGASWFGDRGATREQWLASFTGDEIGGMVQVAPGVVMM